MVSISAQTKISLTFSYILAEYIISPIRLEYGLKFGRRRQKVRKAPKTINQAQDRLCDCMGCIGLISFGTGKMHFFPLICHIAIRYTYICIKNPTKLKDKHCAIF